LNETLGQYVKRIREAKGPDWTLRKVEQVTERLGERRYYVSHSYLSQIEKDEVRPSPDKLWGLHKALGEPYEELMRRAGYLPAVQEEQEPPRIYLRRWYKTDQKTSEEMEQVLETWLEIRRRRQKREEASD